jgi:hypothetical protein
MAMGLMIQPNTDTITITPLEAAMNVLELQAASAITPASYVGVGMDVTTDATGYLNTIDTANTTASFSTNKYENRDAYSQLSLTGVTPLSSSVTTYQGFKFYTNLACFLSYVKVNSSCTATKYYLYASDGSTLLTSGTLSSGAASLSYYLAASTSYYIVAGSDGSSYTRRYDASYSYPVNNTNVNATAAKIIGSADDTGQWFNVELIQTRKLNTGIVQTNAQTITSGFYNFQVVAFRPVTTDTGSITADISFDGGSNYQTGVELNKSLDIVNSGTSLIVKINLNAGASGGTAECRGWGVQLW